MGIFNRKEEEMAEEEARDKLIMKIWENVSKLKTSKDESIVDAQLRIRIYNRPNKAFIESVRVYTGGPWIRFRGRNVGSGSSITVRGSRMDVSALEEILIQAKKGLKRINA